MCRRGPELSHLFLCLLAPHRKRKGLLLSWTPDTAIREEEEEWRAGDTREGAREVLGNLRRGGPQTADT